MTRYRPIMTLKTAQIEALYKGSIDMHVHIAPDPEWDRRLDVVETARYAAQGGMRGYVAKSFFYPTTTESLAARHAVEDTQVFGSVTIGYSTTGGLDYAPVTIRNHAKLGCKVVWFPAFDAEYCRKGIGREGGINILDEKGSLKKEAVEVLEIIKEYDMVLCKGHISYPETYALFAKAAEMGITKMVITHPLSDSWGLFSEDEVQSLVDLGGYVEHVFGSTQARLGNLDPSDMVDWVHKYGAERSIMSTDLAQCMDPNPAEGMRTFIGMMLQFGCTDEEVKLMCQDNPAKLLGIE